MYAQVNRVPMHPDKVAEGIARWQDGLVVAYRAQPGFRGATLLRDLTEGSGAARLILYWETAADSERGAQSAAIQEALIPFQPLVADGIA